MKKTNIILLFLLTVFLVTGSGILFAQEDYEDFKATMGKLMDISYIYVEDMETAQSAIEVAAAIVQFNTNMAVLEPEMEAMDEKYPYLSESDYPEELNETMAEFIEMTIALETSMMKVFEYLTDPEVQAALEMMK